MLLLTRVRFWRRLRLRCVGVGVTDLFLDTFLDQPIEAFRDLRVRIDGFRDGIRIEAFWDVHINDRREARIDAINDGISKSFASPLAYDTRKYTRVNVVIGDRASLKFCPVSSTQRRASHGVIMRAVRPLSSIVA